MQDLAQSSLTLHAKQRSSQRGITDQLIDWTQRFGQAIRRQGAWVYVLRRCDAPSDLRLAMERVHAFGTVVVEGDDRIITVYRNEQASRDLRRTTRPNRRWSR